MTSYVNGGLPRRECIRIDVLNDDVASMQMMLAVQPLIDEAQLRSSFARHVSVLSVETL